MFTGARALTELRDHRTAGLMADLSIVNGILNFNQVVTSDIENFRLTFVSQVVSKILVYILTWCISALYIYSAYGAQTRSIDLAT